MERISVFRCSWRSHRSQLVTNIENVLQCGTECACHRSASRFCNSYASRIARSAVPTCPYQLLCAFSRNMKKTIQNDQTAVCCTLMHMSAAVAEVHSGPLCDQVTCWRFIELRVHKFCLFLLSKGGVLFCLTGTVVAVLVAEPCRLFMYEWFFNDDRTIKEST